MNNDRMLLKCEEMTDRELVASLTVDKSEYQSEFSSYAKAELNNRGLDLSSFMNKVHCYRNNTEEVLDIPSVLEIFKEEHGLWTSILLVNSIGESLFLQKEHLNWICHFFRLK